MALCQFQGRLLVGMGKILRIYDIGKRKMLRKCENKVCLFIYIYIFIYLNNIVGNKKELINIIIFYIALIMFINYYNYY